MAQDESGWCTIESDPGVFTELIKDLGAKGFQVEELYGLDESLLSELDPIFGFIFLFKWDSALESRRKRQATSPETLPDNVFFASQTVQNACATQAILSILLNVPNTAMEVEIGNELQNFKEFASGLGPELCGDAIGSNELIRRAHNSFARPELIAYAPEDGNRSRGGTEDPFHFVSILPVGDTLYEFDGLKPAPISHGQFLGSWTTLALRAIQEKIIATQSAGQGEIRFNLMAVIKDRSAHYRGLIDQQIRLICQLEESLCTHPPIEGDDNDLRNRQIADLIAQNAEWEAKLESEQLKAAQYQRENARRRHNCVPLAVALLRHMASEGLLP